VYRYSTVGLGYPADRDTSTIPTLIPPRGGMGINCRSG